MRWTFLHILQFLWILFLLAFAVALLVACSPNEEQILGPADGPYADSAPVNVLKDMAYKDILFQNTFTKKNDTVFVNYGENRLIDYIPSE